MFSKLWCARVCYAIFLRSKNATLHSKIEHTANHFTVIQTLRVSKSTFSLIEIILKVHIHLSMTHRVSIMQNQEIKNFSTTYPSPIVCGNNWLMLVLRSIQIYLSPYQIFLWSFLIIKNIFLLRSEWCIFSYSLSRSGSWIWPKPPDW